MARFNAPAQSLYQRIYPDEIQDNVIFDSPESEASRVLEAYRKGWSDGFDEGFAAGEISNQFSPRSNEGGL